MKKTLLLKRDFLKTAAMSNDFHDHVNLAVENESLTFFFAEVFQEGTAALTSSNCILCLNRSGKNRRD